ncbi:hypothetical protein TNCV_637501 [Trichonephila clavipes]|nr:hypothetical protein TNCV_637501 [Trichonephila clavipes]
MQKKYTIFEEISVCKAVSLRGLTDSEAWRVVGRLEGGQTQAEVDQAIGVSQSVISRIWNRFWRLEYMLNTRTRSYMGNNAQ